MGALFFQWRPTLALDATSPPWVIPGSPSGLTGGHPTPLASVRWLKPLTVTLAWMNRVNKRVVAVFVDGLRYDMLQHMPFLQSQNTAPLQTLLGYSITCHATMYSGLLPREHGLWFHWLRSDQSPFQNTSNLSRIPFFDIWPTRAVLSKALTRRIPTTSFVGYPRIVNLSYKYWDRIDTAEKRYWDEDDYLGPGSDAKTIFEMLRQNEVPYYTSGLHRPDLGLLETLEIPEEDASRFEYYFVGEVDRLSHLFGPHSRQLVEYYGKLDAFCRDLCEAAERKDGDYTFIFWSDHGHIPIKHHIDLFKWFRKNGANLHDHFAIVDSTFARFWPASDRESEHVERIMSEVPGIYRVDEEMARVDGLPLGDSRYGDMIFGLHGGYQFNKTIHGFGRKNVSMHGYLPGEDGNDGVFASNRQVTKSPVTLPDIFWTLLENLDLDADPLPERHGTNAIG
jgi:hypothetical protein